MENKIAQIAKAISSLKNVQFASLTYLSKSANELARYTVNLGFSYHKAVEKSVTELEILMAENAGTWGELEKQAAEEVMASLKKTLEAHAHGEQNDDYTKKDQYVHIGNGLNLNSNDNTLQLFGLVNSKVVITEGERKAVKSKPLTIAKNKIRKQLSMSKFREFALDESQISGVKINGDSIELTPAEGFTFEVNPPSAVVINSETVLV